MNNLSVQGKATIFYFILYKNFSFYNWIYQCIMKKIQNNCYSANARLT